MTTTAHKKTAKKTAAEPKPAHVDAPRDKIMAAEHDAQVKRTGEAVAAKKATDGPGFKELVSRDERHDSIDPATGTLTPEAVALRAQHGISNSGEQAPKQNVAVEVPEGDSAVRQPGGAMITVQPGESAAAPPISQPVTAGVVNTTGSMGFAPKED